MKKLKNSSLSNYFINDTGQTVPAEGELIIDPADYALYARSNDVILAIANSNLVYNDGEADLTLAEATAHLQGSFPKTIKLPSETPLGVPKVAVTKPDGDSKTYTSHNFCDDSTWPATNNSVWQLDSVVEHSRKLKV